MFQTLLRFFKNKYVLVTLAFIIWILFFDRNNLITQFKLTKKVRKMNDHKEYYLDEIKKNRQAIQDLTTDTQSLERYAREKHLMKKDNEDIYIIVEEEETP